MSANRNELLLAETSALDPPKSPLKRGTLNPVPPSLRRALNPIPPFLREALNPVPPFLRGARGDQSRVSNLLNVTRLMKHFKRETGVAMLVIWAIVLPGCRPSPPDRSVTIKLSGWQSSPAEKQLLEKVIQEFETKNPEIKVKYETINSEYMDVIRTRLIGEVAPDVFYLDALEAPMLMKYEVLEPLDHYIKPEFDLADFEPSLLNAFKHNGKLYGLPKDFSTLALVYNQQAFQAVGITQPPTNWEALMADSKKLTIDKNRDGKIEQYGLGIAPELARQVYLIKAFGGRLTNQSGYAAFAEPNSLKGLEYVVNQYRRDRTAAQPTDVGASGVSEMLGQGKAAMVIDGPWSIPYFKETFPNLRFATAEIPTMNGKSGTMAFTVAYVMNRKSTHKQAAWKLIEYLTGKVGMKTWATQGLVLPSRRSVQVELGYRNNPLYAPFLRGSRYATIWQAGENLPTIRMNFNNQFISALLGEQPFVEAMKRAEVTANREIYWSN